MDDAELAKWLREELPHLTALNRRQSTVVDALTVLLALLREADDHLRYARTDLDAFLARLRAVLGD